MVNLIPTELHYYSLLDVARGLAAARGRQDLQAAISFPGLGDGMPIRSARAATIVALKALGMPPGSRIGVPLYCCPVVFKAIKAADCTPRFLDIDPETFCLSAEDLQAKRSGIDALIAVHMFGNLCDMPKILEIMAGMPVIEDCAQSLGSKFDGRACGSFGDIAFFSFRSGKYLSVGEGGALYSIRADLRARISELIKDLPIPTPYQEMKHMAETYIRSKLRSQPGWGLVGTKIWSLYNKRTEFADKSPIVLSRIFTSDLATARRRMPHLGTMISIQRAYAEYYENTLHLDAGMYCLEKPPAFYNRFMYPLIFPSRGQRDTMAAHLKMYGIGTSSPYEEAIAGAAKHYRYAGDCPSAERILQTALVIPSFYKLKSQAVERIAKRIGEAWSADIRHHHSPRPDGERRT